MKKVYFIGILLLMIIMLLVLTGCGNTNKNSKTTSGNKTATNTSNKENNTNKTNEQTSQESIDNVNFEENAKKQMEEDPKDGDTVAIFHVKNFGDIKVKFFPEIAPKAVENFTTHAKEGYYNGLTFHRVINDFMIQGGDPLGNGTGGESIWGKGFGTELDYSLVPYRGSLCMAMSSLPNSIGSQFFITQANYSEDMNNALKNAGYPKDLLEQYKNYGGYLSLYMNYTVFGQVYEGMEVVDAIASVETKMSSSGEKSVPVEDVIIDSIEVTTYKAQ